MIRREFQSAWAMIPQTVHARLAAELAHGWMTPPLHDFRWNELLFEAIATHDDGWNDYETAPQVAPETGIPRDFTEMPMAVSTQIWSQGISAAGQHAPWCGLWISGHFCQLAELAAESRKENPDDLAAIDAFLQQQSDWKEQWRDAVRELSQSPMKDEQFGVECLRFFDRVSLWLSCADQAETWTVTAPDGTEIRWRPLSNIEFAVTPYPWMPPEREFALAGRLIPHRTYADDADLQQALAVADPILFRWRVVPDGAGSL